MYQSTSATESEATAPRGRHFQIVSKKDDCSISSEAFA